MDHVQSRRSSAVVTGRPRPTLSSSYSDSDEQYYPLMRNQKSTRESLNETYTTPPPAVGPGAGARQPWRRDLEGLRVYNQQYQDDGARPAVSDDMPVNVDPFLYDYTPKKSSGK